MVCHARFISWRNAPRIGVGAFDFGFGGDMSKGSTRRPCQISREEEDLRWALALGRITKEEYDAEYARLEAEGKIMRGGR